MSTVFVGKIANTSSRDSITAFFASAGAVKRVNINTKRTPYAFVEFESADSVQKAVEMFNGKTLDGSVIVVEVAKPKPPKKPRASLSERKPAAATAAPVDGNVAAVAAERKPHAPRRSRRALPPDAPISKTIAYVGNLPFVVDEESMKDIFEGCKFLETRVVRKPDGRSKGFGFVTFPTEEDRAEAIKLTDGSVVEGRKISVHPARELVDRPKVESPVAASVVAEAK